MQGKMSKSTPTKATTRNGKSSQETLKFGQERLQACEKENNDNLD